MDSFETEYRWAQSGWADCRITLDTTRRALEVAQKEAQRWQAHSVLVEDQRDAARKERDTLREQLNDLQAGMRQWEDEHASAVTRVIAERDALRKQLDDIRHDYTDKSYWGKE